MIRFFTGIMSVVLLASSILAREMKPDPKLDDLRESWISAMQDLDIPGAAVVVVRGDDVVLLESLGVRNVDSKESVTPDTMFYIASCTKSFMAMAVLTLVEDGKIELDTPVKKYLPQFQVDDAELSEKLTIRDLLSHAKGLDSSEITFGEAYTGDIDEARFWRMMKTAKAEGKFKYTNLHYTILGRVVAAVTGKSWKDFVEERVCRPAGMTRTTAYASRMYGDSNVAIPTIYWDKKLIAAIQRKTDRTMHAAGGMGSTANDLARWLRLNLNGGEIDGTRVLSEELMQQMQQRQSKTDPEKMPVPEMFRDGYALGWQTGTFHGKRFLMHGGGYVGSAAVVVMIPEEKIGLAVVANTDAGGSIITMLATVNVLERLFDKAPSDLMSQIRPRHEQFRQRRAEQAATATQAVTAKSLSLPLSAYAGRYVHNDLGTIVIAQSDGKLTFEFGDLKPQLFATDTPDNFTTVFSGGTLDGGRFAVDGNTVKAIIVRSDDEETRFERE